MGRTLAVASSLVTLATPHAAPRQTAAHAQIHLLRAYVHMRTPARLGGLIDRTTGLAAVNTQARCVGVGGPLHRTLYRRVTCVLRPMHRRGQGI